MEGLYGSGAVRSSALRTKQVRGTYGATDTYRFRAKAKVDITDCFIWVPEIRPTVTVQAKAYGTKNRANASAFIKPSAKGTLSDFYVIMPSFICNVPTHVFSTAGVRQGHLGVPGAAVVSGQSAGFVTRVGSAVGSTAVSCACDLTAILFDGKPKLQLDERCCVFN